MFLCVSQICFLRVCFSVCFSVIFLYVMFHVSVSCFSFSFLFLTTFSCICCLATVECFNFLESYACSYYSSMIHHLTTATAGIVVPCLDYLGTVPSLPEASKPVTPTVELGKGGAQLGIYFMLRNNPYSTLSCSYRRPPCLVLSRRQWWNNLIVLACNL